MWDIWASLVSCSENGLYFGTRSGVRIAVRLGRCVHVRSIAECFSPWCCGSSSIHLCGFIVATGSWALCFMTVWFSCWFAWARVQILVQVMGPETEPKELAHRTNLTVGRRSVSMKAISLANAKSTSNCSTSPNPAIIKTGATSQNKDSNMLLPTHTIIQTKLQHLDIMLQQR